MASSSGQHVVNVHELSASTKQKLQMLPPLSSECCIYRAPDRMLKANGQDFTPRMVSIGPIHYQKKRLMAMEHMKERYLAEFLQFTPLSLEECFQIILINEKRLRNCYAHVIELESETFVKMVLVDAAFLIMVLVLSDLDQTAIGTADRLYRKPFMIYDIRFDMMLLENQLPFFILEDLYAFSKLHHLLPKKVYKERAMTVLACRFLKRWISPRVPEHILELNPPSKAEHILDLFRSCFIQEDWIHYRRTWTETTNIHSLKELCQAGIKIRVGSEIDMFDIRFHNGILEIPPIKVHNSTEIVFRNLLAFELCHCPEKHIFSDYFEIMRLFTLSSPDVKLLIENGVIENSLPNAEAVRTLFHNISIGNLSYWHESPYGYIIKDLIDYYEVDWHRWKATWKEKYFKAPWAICSFSAALLVLVLTIVQVLTILQVAIKK